MDSPKIIELKYLRHLLKETKAFLLSRTNTPELSLNMLPKFNELIWGIQRKALTVIGARTSEGKSALAVQIAYDLAIQQKTVLFLSLETTVEKMAVRLFCLHNRYHNVKALRGGLKEDLSPWNKFEAEIGVLPLIINDMIGRTWEEIDQVLSTTKLKPDVVIVDYIQTIADREGRTKLDMINEYIRHFREMAIRNEFAGILCSQLNRTTTDDKSREPQLHQLKGSGFLEEHADLVLLLSWPWKHLKQNASQKASYEQFHKFNIYVAKNKDGQTGYMHFKFTPEFYLFEDWSDLPPQEKEQIQQPVWRD